MSKEDERRARTVAELAQDPEAAKRLTSLLESLRDLAQHYGSAEVGEALSASFGLMADPRLRQAYDAMRAELIRHLRQLDLPPEGHDSRSPELVASPEVSPDEIEALAGQLASKVSDPDPS